jgi:hypothetical protein
VYHHGCGVERERRAEENGIDKLREDLALVEVEIAP